jgi:hypothetical protein
MNSLEPRRGGGLSRRQKEQWGYRLVFTGGLAGLVTVVGLVLAIAGVIGAGIPVLAAVVAVICFVLFRRLVAPR